MKYQTMEPWFIGTRLIPAGFIYNDSNTDDITNLARGLTPPLHSLCLDQVAANTMFGFYGQYWWPYIQCCAGVTHP